MENLDFVILPVTRQYQNCTLMWCLQTHKGVVVDPGGEEGRIEMMVAKHGVALQCVLVTHNHFDHVDGAEGLAKAFDIPIVSSFMGDRIDEGDEIAFGCQKLEVLRCPGHTDDHVVFVNHQERLINTGDTLFKGEIALTDGVEGDFTLLRDSIRTKLFPLVEYAFIPGHGSCSTIRHELINNKYCQ